MADSPSEIVRRDQLALAHALGVLRMARRARDAGALDSTAALQSAYDVIAEGHAGARTHDGERGPIVDIVDAALHRGGPDGQDPLDWAEHSMQQRLDQTAPRPGM
jgi:hypothetical protein